MFEDSAFPPPKRQWKAGDAVRILPLNIYGRYRPGTVVGFAGGRYEVELETGIAKVVPERLIGPEVKS
jgi:hypothetical protein